MIAAFNAFFAFFAALFRGATNLAEAAENMSRYAKDESEFFNENAEASRDRRRVESRAAHAQLVRDLGISEDIAEIQSERRTKRVTGTKS
ncbi:hypothetical protein FCMLKIFP_00064 [Pseudomonas phage Ka3]|uniref:Uncharacterized protein n=2 Tax=Luzseptimavirus KPP21 TaxID=1982595 RepID=A0A7S5W9C4_9CAUD|nr:hypothetical protein AVU12_gp044 [Pseudomonas phage KPP21]QKE56008.1 hypothetical protein AMP2_gp060 [Pseudomonas phage vB_Pae_AM.P2]QWY17748.1 hypothetical protein [Pseudomonas phage vB_Pae-PA152]UGL60852.1 hypothetical protein [Pseudomonas phage vB_PaeS_TUMS_P6]WQZ52414.1 hypothetical protein FCMLKIFP_00064 [Pseudomonas phage Ka3]UGL60957.1 hypothetical protein [Pseudomonas phage vB_PaeS_TUMS_P6]